MQIETRYEFIWGAWVIRFSLGMLFFVAGLGKFLKGAAIVSASIADSFKGTWLPAPMVIPFAYTLPYLEVSLGVLLLLGLLRMIAVPLGSLLMLSLTFGMMVAGNAAIMANNMFYVMIFAAALFTSPWDRFTLDALIFSRKAKL